MSKLPVFEYPKAVISSKGRASIQRKHPWIFSGAISQIDPVVDGDIVRIEDTKCQILGVGYYQDATIAIRVLSFEACTIDLGFWTDRIRRAKELRAMINLPSANTNTYRLIHGEGDLLPGLIIDIYDAAAVIQCHAIGMHKFLPDIVDALLSVYGEQLDTIYNKSYQTLPKQYAQHHRDGFLYGAKSMVLCKENEVTFEIDLINSQKTGFFIDQRDNRQLLGTLANGKKVLNLFCYTGGFSLYALKAGASEVVSIDISEKAIAQVEKNIATNGQYDNHTSMTEDVLKYLTEIPSDLYDIIVVDPPAFAKSQHKKHNAVQAYKRLNAAAIRKVKKAGIIMTFSCSQVIDQTLFYNTITAAAMECNRDIQVLHLLSQGADHPVNIFHPEGKYLKGLVLLVH